MKPENIDEELLKVLLRSASSVVGIVGEPLLSENQIPIIASIMKQFVISYLSLPETYETSHTRCNKGCDCIIPTKDFRTGLVTSYCCSALDGKNVNLGQCCKISNGEYIKGE